MLDQMIVGGRIAQLDSRPPTNIFRSQIALVTNSSGSFLVSSKSLPEMGELYFQPISQERRIRFPARKVSSVTFGSEDFIDMYVTTAWGTTKQKMAREPEPCSD